MLEEAGLEAWAVDILGWGFSDLGYNSFYVIYVFTLTLNFYIRCPSTKQHLLKHEHHCLLLVVENRPPCDVASKRYHLYQVSSLVLEFLSEFCNVVSSLDALLSYFLKQLI